MSYRDRMKDIVGALQSGVDRSEAAAKRALANSGPKIIALGVEMDRLSLENERLGTIVNLVELKGERDDLKKRVARLEALHRVEPDAMIIPTEEQVERACALIAKAVGRNWPEDMDLDEIVVWRATYRSMLVIVTNKDAILDGRPTQ